MPTIAIITRADHTVATFYEDVEPNQAKFGGPWGWPDHTVHVEVPSSMDPSVVRAVPLGEKEYTFEVDDEKLQTKLTQQWQQLRWERNSRLANCDWTHTLDAPITLEQRESWAEYRRTLRALPGLTVDPFKPMWPLSPSDPVPVPIPVPIPTEVTEPVPEEVTVPIPTEVLEPVPLEVTEPVPTDVLEPVPTEVLEPVPAEVLEPVPAEVLEPVPTEVLEPVPAEVLEPVPTEVLEPVPEEVTEPAPEPVPTEVLE